MAVDTWDPGSFCTCGHVLDDHDGDTLNCTRDGCSCAGHEPVDLEADYV